MLEDRHRRLREESHELARRIGVEHVVPGQLFALNLLETTEDACPPDGAIDSSGLMRVLPVARLELALELQSDARRLPTTRRLVGRRSRSSGPVLEPADDRRVVGLGVLESLQGKLSAVLERHRPVTLAQRGQHGVVVGRIDDHHNPFVVLGRRPGHARSTDVDHLNRLGRGHSLPGDRLLERIEIDGDDVDRGDSLLGKLGHVALVGSIRQDAAVNARVKGLDPTPQDLWRLGDRRDLFRFDSVGAEMLQGATGGDHFDAELYESACEGSDTGLVGNGEQGAPGSKHGSGSPGESEELPRLERLPR